MCNLENIIVQLKVFEKRAGYMVYHCKQGLTLFYYKFQ